MSEVRTAWAAIAAEGRHQAGWHARRVRVGSPCDIRAAVAVPGGTAALLFEVQSRSIPAAALLPDCVGFALTPETMAAGPGGQVRLCLALRDVRFREVFETLADDVVAAVAVAPSEAAGVRALLARLRTWERFVQRHGAGTLSEERQLGLFAELRCLSSYLMPRMDLRAAVQAWRGPHGEPQDFRVRAAAVEVKATASRNPQLLRVSNLDQLDPGALELLLVHHLAVDLGAPAGNTLADAVDTLRSTLGAADPAAASDLDDALIEAGWLDQHRAAYAGTRYTVRATAWYRVDGGFPRLTRRTVQSGIGDAKYTVLLPSCAPYAVAESDALAMLREKI